MGRLCGTCSTQEAPVSGDCKMNGKITETFRVGTHGVASLTQPEEDQHKSPHRR